MLAIFIFIILDRNTHEHMLKKALGVDMSFWRLTKLKSQLYEFLAVWSL